MILLLLTISQIKMSHFKSSNKAEFLYKISEEFKDLDEYDICQLEVMFNKILNKEPPKTQTLHEQLINYNVYNEYNSICNRIAVCEDDLDTFDKSKYLIFKGIIKMAEFDPLNGNKPDIMTDEDKLYWDDLENNIKDGGRLLDPNHYDLLWSFIPKSVKHKILMLFEEI